MALEKPILPYWEWLFSLSLDNLGAFWSFLIIAVAVGLAALIFSFIVATARYGPLKAGDICYRVVVTGAKELFLLSPRRLGALTWLAIQEAIRRKIYVALIIYVLMLLFASWFLMTETPEPLKINVSTVLTSILYLVVTVSLMISVFSLPADLKNRTIYTLVTKPVRAGEIVLGRILGFGIVGMGMLAIMALIGYVFIVRSLAHSHEIEAASIVEINEKGESGRTTLDSFHRHEIEIDNEGNGQTDIVQGHWHSVHKGADGKYVVSEPIDAFPARVQLKGKLRHLDRAGGTKDRGISVGNEWTYRSFIEGGTDATAIWTFDGLRAEEFPDGLPLELTIRVFRSYKGNIKTGILGSLQLRNPDDPKIVTKARTFRAKDFKIDSQLIPLDLTDSSGKPLSLFKDLVTKDGRVEIWLKCLDRGQYYGVAQDDLYVRIPGGNFAWNYIKGCLGIAAQMWLVVAIGVLFSTFVSGPVALFAAIGTVVLGFFTEFILSVAMGTLQGGGPIEALYRTVTRKNMVIELDKTIGNSVMQNTDEGIRKLMYAWAKIVPDFRDYDSMEFVANGYNIPGNLLAQNLTACVAFVLAAYVAGYFFFRIREVAK